jgi:hypothetical protein
MGDSPWRLVALDHVQLAMPPGGEAAARAFYVGVLGLVEIPKPAELEGRGGVWFGVEGVELHLGVDPDFRPARKAHPGLRVTGLPALCPRRWTAWWAGAVGVVVVAIAAALRRRRRRASADC